MEDLMIVQKEETIKTVVQEKETNKIEVKKEDIYLIICSVLLGMLFDILFYKKALGVSYLLFVIAFYGAFLWNLRHKIVFRLSFGWFLSIPIIGLSFTYVIFSNQIFGSLNFIMVPILIIAQTILINEENKYQWYDAKFIEDIFFGLFNRALGNTSKPFLIGLHSLRIRKSPEKYDVFKKILIGLTISVPLLIIIVSLLASADRVFEHFLAEILSSFGNINIGDFSVQGIIVLIIAIIVFSYIWSFSNNKDSRQARLEQRSLLDTNIRSWDPIISITILVAINSVYLIFIIIQFAYMFGAINNALPPDFTYSEYARRGFFELLMVTLINFSILLSSLSFTRKDGRLVARTVRILNSLLVLCTMVILTSAFFRMSLYEAAYGYTYLRVLTHSFMMYLCVLFVIAFYKIWNEGISLLKPYIVVSLMAYMLLNFVNIDVIIAKNNISRYVETGKLDPHYLRNLSYDSIPVVVELLNDDKSVVANDIRNYLVEKQNELSIKQSWQSLNWSKQKAKRALSQHSL